jgi:hypothetical protein
LVKRRNLRDFIFEFIIPLVITAFGLVIRQYVRDYYSFVVFFLAYLISGNCCRFTLSQLSREKELKISDALQVMNVSPIAVHLSYLIIQLPLSLYSAILIMICDEMIDSPIYKLCYTYITSLALILTIHILSLVLLSFFGSSDSNKATQIGFLLLLLSVIPFNWFTTICQDK